ncbi:hypothetical protein [Salinimonas chungwhensis]|uniref:hypothetical protein n=1 Tax=Salinimonas chungwhensis TaxID=265425 RepID=UPI00039C12EA|nr:hypothetical protein [Salinimonas chungwhensis]
MFTFRSTYQSLRVLQPATPLSGFIVPTNAGDFTIRVIPHLFAASSLRIPGRYYLVLFLAVLLWLPVPLGAVSAWGWPVLSAGVLLMTLCYIRQFPVTALPVLWQNRYLLILWLCLLLWHLVLLIPLPESVMDMVRPQRTFLSLKQHNHWLALTYSTTDTIISFFRTLTYGCMFTLALLLFRTAHRLKLLLRCLLVVGLFEMLYASLHLFSGAPKSLFLDIKTGPAATGTLLDAFAYGHLLLIALFAVLALLIIRIKPSVTGNQRQRMRRLVNYFFGKKTVLRVAALLIFAGLVMTILPDVIWATVVSTVLSVMAAFCLFSPRPRRLSTFMISLLTANILMILAASYLAERHPLPSSDLFVTLEDKQWAPMTPGRFDHWLLGSGPGTVKNTNRDAHFIHVTGTLPAQHTAVFQFIQEYGLIASLLYLGVFLYCFMSALKAMAHRRHLVFRAVALCCTGVFTGTVYLAVVSTSLQTPVITAYVTVLMGVSLVSLQCRKYQKA